MCFGSPIGHPELRSFTQTFPEHAVILPFGDALSSVPAGFQFGFFWGGWGVGRRRLCAVRCVT